MAAPLGHSIKLYAVRELHLLLTEDTSELALPLPVSPMLAIVLRVAALVGFSTKILEFYHVLVASPAMVCKPKAQVGPSGAQTRVAGLCSGVHLLRKLTGGIIRDRLI